MALAAPSPASTALRWRGARAPLFTATGLGLVAVALRFRDPHRHASWGLCPFKALTGWDCPGCGGLRAVNDLGHGQLGAAWHSNALFIALLPLVAVLWSGWLVGSWSGRRRRLPDTVVRYGAIGFVLLAVAFTVFRNTPAGSAWFAT